jgi:hypothetical protein
MRIKKYYKNSEYLFLNLSMEGGGRTREGGCNMAKID